MKLIDLHSIKFVTKIENGEPITELLVHHSLYYYHALGSLQAEMLAAATIHRQISPSCIDPFPLEKIKENGTVLHCSIT